MRFQEKDSFLKYFKNYANNADNLNESLIFNKINNKGKYQSLKAYKPIQNISRNNKEIIKNKILNNQKISFSKNGNFLSLDEKLKSKQNSSSTIFRENKIKILSCDKKTSTQELNYEIEKNDTKPYTDRKIVNKNINRSINHPYYSPSVIIKKKKYELFLKNTFWKKADKAKIVIKSIKDLGIYHVASSK